MDDAPHGWVVVGKALDHEIPKQYEPNRRCKKCGHKISIYNKLEECLHHVEFRDEGKKY
jgi:hypothetical protein